MMAFRKPRQQPQFAQLKGSLAQNRRDLDHATYQVIQEIIERLIQFQSITVDDIALINEELNSPTNGLASLTYITEDDETSILTASRQLLAGTNITLDTSVAGQITISASGGGSDTYDAPLSDGDLTEAELIFADGECIIVQVPNP